MEQEGKDILEESGVQPEDMADPVENQPDVEQVANEEETTVRDLKDKYLRLLAEFDNYKKRTSKERIEFAKFAAQDLVVSLLPVLDDFDRAVKHGQVSEGTSLIHHKLVQVLKQKGLEEMQSQGQTFDPALHEALTEIEVPEDQKNKVIETLEKGYYLADRIIRFAKVVVGK
ncbi:MAG TPA: nucleotide exchange factor GrpE [Saprospiraceae bacterium]|nr:nucleotide exchange factor GrpE [Saprospiraceae bacterium]HNT21860.1 nucleotide exchange factor GrpE [Saprospiraceae bacterium]